MIDNINEWRNELIDLGAIASDDDTSVPVDEAQARFDRYTNLVGAVDGTEGPAVVAALVAYMRVKYDYGAYQATHGALALFPAGVFVQGVAMAISALVENPRDHSAEVLAGVASSDQVYVREFNSLLSNYPPDLRGRLRDLIDQEEQDGWLSDDNMVGRLRP